MDLSQPEAVTPVLVELSDLVRASHTGFNPGSKHPLAKLDEAKALEIYRRRAAGESGKALAEEFGVSASVVANIWNRITWLHATEDVHVRHPRRQAP